MGEFAKNLGKTAVNLQAQKYKFDSWKGILGGIIFGIFGGIIGLLVLILGIYSRNLVVGLIGFAIL
jgi:predicted lipid-binding transport protein (Tim44 family)